MSINPSIEGNATNIIRYPRYKKHFSLVRHCIQLTLDGGEPRCAAFEGPPGAGKTTLVKDCLNQSGFHESERLYIDIPDNPAPKSLVSEVLENVGDPAHKDIRYLWEAKGRLINFVKKKKYKIVAFDDFQHLFSERYMTMEEAAEYLKKFIKDTGVVCLVTGIQGEIIPVLKSNKQFDRLFLEPQTVGVFSWDEKSEDAISECQTLISKIQETVDLPFLLYDKLNQELFGRIIYSTKGIMANIIDLIRLARIMAKEDRAKAITLEHFSRAFVERLETHVEDRYNPFDKAINKPFIHELKPLPPKPLNTKNLNDVLSTR